MSKEQHLFEIDFLQEFLLSLQFNASLLNYSIHFKNPLNKNLTEFFEW